MDALQNENEMVETTVYSVHSSIKDMINCNSWYPTIEECVAAYQILGLNEIYKYNIWIFQSEVIKFPQEGQICG